MRRKILIGTAIAVLGGAAVAVSLITLCCSDSESGAPLVVGEQSGAVSGGTGGLCVEQYSIENLRKREFAFDGLVRSVVPDAETGSDKVTFTVTTWYKGGPGREVTLDATAALTPNSAGGPMMTPGTRLLVSGDETFVWLCGFSRAWSAGEAAQWRAAFAG